MLTSGEMLRTQNHKMLRVAKIIALIRADILKEKRSPFKMPSRPTHVAGNCNPRPTKMDTTRVPGRLSYDLNWYLFGF